MLYLNDYEGALKEGVRIHASRVAGEYLATSSNVTLGASHYLVNVTSGSPTITLPISISTSTPPLNSLAGYIGQIYVIKNSGTGTVTIAATAGQLIDGASTYSNMTQYLSVNLLSTGSGWVVF